MSLRASLEWVIYKGQRRSHAVQDILATHPDRKAVDVEEEIDRLLAKGVLRLVPDHEHPDWLVVN